MRAVTTVHLYEADTRFFGPGPYRLLSLIEETGSIRAASEKMDLSYSKAHSMVKRAETALGFPLIEKQIGGKGGGGSYLTVHALEFMKKYKRYQEECCETNQRIYNEIFSK